MPSASFFTRLKQSWWRHFFRIPSYIAVTTLKTPHAVKKNPIRYHPFLQMAQICHTLQILGWPGTNTTGLQTAPVIFWPHTPKKKRTRLINATQPVRNGSFWFHSLIIWRKVQKNAVSGKICGATSPRKPKQYRVRQIITFLGLSVRQIREYFGSSRLKMPDPAKFEVQHHRANQNKTVSGN